MKNINVRCIPYAGSSWGDCSDLVIVQVDADYNISGLRKLAEAISSVMWEYSHDSSTGSQFDCTGLPFGSNWKRINYTKTEDGYVAVLVHNWSIDI